MSERYWQLDEAREVIGQRNAEILRQNAELRMAAAEIRSLREALKRARDNMEGWAAYAGEYFRQRHHLALDLKDIDDVLNEPKPARGVLDAPSSSL